MSETEADRAYYAASEAAFIRRRGTPFLLSPKDFALIKQWRQLEIPIEAVERGIEEAFRRREERGARGRVNSLAYCRDAVLEAWERLARVSVGRGGGRAAGELDAAAGLERLQGVLEGFRRRRPDLAPAVEAALRSLERLAKERRDAAQIEESLARLDRRLATSLYEGLPAGERRELDGRVQELLSGVRVRMDEETERKTQRALTRRVLRERLDLPRLTLLVTTGSEQKRSDR